MSEQRRVDVLGVNMSVVDLETTTKQVIVAARKREPLGVSALAVHGVMSAVTDPDLRHRINELELVVPDGQPVRWAMNWLHDARLDERVPGPDLMWEVCRVAAAEGHGVFLYGSTAETLGLLEQRLTSELSGLQIHGIQASRFRSVTEAERVEDLERITESGASIVFAGLGCPRQEIWTYENRFDLGIPVLAVGAAFDFHAGRLRRAPQWMGQAGLEWVFRLYQEPQRLTGRYLKQNPKFLALVAAQKAGRRSFSGSLNATPNRIRPG